MGLKRAKSTFVLYNSYGITYLTIGDVLVSVVFLYYVLTRVWGSEGIRPGMCLERCGRHGSCAGTVHTMEGDGYAR